MITSSKYLQITPYCLLEYIYNSTVISTSKTTFARIYNAYNGTVNYVNHNKDDLQISKELTGNTFDTTVGQRRENEWFHFDLDRPIKWFETQNDNIYVEGLWSERDKYGNIIYDQEIAPEQYITYDTVKIHLLEGYNFDDLAGLIVKIGYTDPSNFTSIWVANFAYIKEQDVVDFNTRPFILGDRVYNRYVEFKIPSLNGLIDADDTLQTSLAPDDPPFNVEFPNYQNSQINIIFYEVNRIKNENGQLVLFTNLPIGSETNGVVRLLIEPDDSLKNIAAVVQESGNGDYFELYPTHNGYFIEDFLYSRAKFGEEYRVIHDIDVYEQLAISGDYYETHSQSITFFQEEGFNKPYKFRPIIENSNTITFTIDYTVRLLNISDSANPIQTIRKASFTYPNAKKYGRWFQRLNIDQGYKPLKVVNKIIRDDQVTNQLGEYNINKTSSSSTSEINNIFMPIQMNKIVVNAYTLFVDNDGALTYQDDPNNSEDEIQKIELKEFLGSDIIYGQGEGIIYLTDFDNFVKFKVYKLNNKGEPEVYTELKNSSYTDFNLVFENQNGEKIRFKEFSGQDNINVTLEDGELLFKVDSTNVRNILKSTNPKFYITIENSTTDSDSTSLYSIDQDYEIPLYTGFFTSIDSYKEYETMTYKLKEEILTQRQETIEFKELKIQQVTQDFNETLRDIRGLELTKTQQNVLDEYVEQFEEIIENLATDS